MQKHSFHGLVAHKAEHDRFIKTISSYKEMLIADKLFLSIEIINYLKDWIVEHISVSDKNYCSYLISRRALNLD
jgi:hemerythrin-like metal-binding protein